jgi:hypothetical protein
MSKVVKKIPGVKNVTKIFDKIVPNELKPFAAPIAAYYLGPMALKGLGGAGLTGVKGFLARAAASGATSAATQALMGEDISKASTALSALSGGLGAGYGGQGAQTADGIRAAKVAGVTPAGETIRAGQLAGMDFEAANALDLASPGITGQAQNIALEAAAKGTKFLTPTTGKGIATLAGTAGAASGIEQQMKLLDEYNQSLTAQGIEDKTERVNLIKRYMTNAGFDESQITDALGRYGYLANGGRVGYEMGGDVEEYTTFTPARKKIEEGLEAIGVSDVAREFLQYKRGEKQIEELPALLQYMKYYGGKLFQGSVDPTAEPREFSKLSPEKQQEYLDAISEREAIMNRKAGGPINEDDVSFTDYGRSGVIYRDPEGNVISKEEFLRRTDEEEGIPSIRMKKEPKTLKDLLEDPELIKQMLRQNKKDGGIMNLQGREMDLRGGGFVPIGAKERADDVPARLSKNEFVFTADAVRSAGNGDVNKGAQKMYNTMKMLEGKLA